MSFDEVLRGSTHKGSSNSEQVRTHLFQEELSPAFNEVQPFAPLQQKQEVKQALPEGFQRVQHFEDEVALNEFIIDERDKQTQVIHSGTVQMHEMMTDLNTIAKEQAVFVDSIESHIEDTSHYVEKANKEIGKANIRQKKKSTAYAWIAAIGSGALAVLVTAVAIAL